MLFCRSRGHIFSLLPVFSLWLCCFHLMFDSADLSKIAESVTSKSSSLSHDSKHKNFRFGIQDGGNLTTFSNLTVRKKYPKKNSGRDDDIVCIDVIFFLAKCHFRFQNKGSRGTTLLLHPPTPSPPERGHSLLIRARDLSYHSRLSLVGTSYMMYHI